MPKLPRDVSHDRVIRFLKRRGWHATAGARHTLLFKDGAETTVPRHATLTTGTLRAILKQAGIEPGEWADL